MEETEPPTNPREGCLVCHRHAFHSLFLSHVSPVSFFSVCGRGPGGKQILGQALLSAALSLCRSDGGPSLRGFLVLGRRVASRGRGYGNVVGGRSGPHPCLTTTSL